MKTEETDILRFWCLHIVIYVFIAHMKITDLEETSHSQHPASKLVG